MDEGELAAAGAQLAGEPVVACEAVRGGGNNRLYRLQTARATYALKCYPASAVDPADRLAHEFGGLRFLRDHGVSEVPAAIAADRPGRRALFEWIPGERVAAGGRALDEMLAFATRLHALRAAPGAATLPAAVEAVVTGADLRAQIAMRISRLAPVAAGEPELAAFLDGEVAACLAGLPEQDEVRPPVLTLSPSDFGAHNMLRRTDGRPVFLDFEYFGWDDPVKLVCDVLWHPALGLDGALARKFLVGAADIYTDDPSFGPRLERRYPAFGLRWALIVLNEFLPARWEQRRAAGAGDDWGAAKARQLAKARALVARAAAARRAGLWQA